MLGLLKKSRPQQEQRQERIMKEIPLSNGLTAGVDDEASEIEHRANLFC